MANTTDIILFHQNLEEESLLLLVHLHFMLELILQLLHGTNIVSVLSGQVTLAQFNGAGGCTVIVNSEFYQITYCHVSPNFLVYVGQYVKKGELIAYVGPKNIYGFSNNYFKDASGNPTNGSTTGPHLHLNIKRAGTIVDPLSLF
jgi:murein DD-endopeptidase MepM/ murein hydrolase activator NlpD